MTKLQNTWIILQAKRAGERTQMTSNYQQHPDRCELARAIALARPEEGISEVAPGLHFVKLDAPSQPVHGVYSPAICVIAQGAKEVQMGDETLRYDCANYLISSLAVPVISRVVEATKEAPYLSLKLDLDPALIAMMVSEIGTENPVEPNHVPSIAVNELDEDLLNAFLRLVRLLKSEGDFRILSPLIVREIIYRLLTGSQASRLRQMISIDHSNRMAKAVSILRNNFDKPLRIEELAKDLGMSTSSFHQHFKTVTSMSPLQYQKQLRLQEARRLLLFEGMDAGGAAAQVGYDDASQFSREYKRLFGEPPSKDLARFKQLSMQAS